MTSLVTLPTRVIFTFRAAMSGALIWTLSVTSGGRGLKGTVPPPSMTFVVL